MKYNCLYNQKDYFKIEVKNVFHKNIFYLAALSFLLIVNSGIAGSFGVAKYAGEFLSTGGGARALGMGGAFVAVGDGAEAGYWNPAGLSTIKYPQILGMHSRRFGGIVNYDYAAFAIPFRKDEGLALNIIRLAVDDIPKTDVLRRDLDVSDTNRPFVERWISNADYAFYFSYAKKKSDFLRYGANVKFIRKGVGDDSAWGIGFDLGVLLNPVGKLQVGVNFQDATTTLLAWNTGTQELISPTLKTGLAYPIKLNFISSTALIVGDVDIRFEGRRFASQAHIGDISFDFHAGTEVLIKKIVALRVGTDIGYFSAGAGLRLPKLAVDYAFLSHVDLGKTHRVSLCISIEEDKFARK